MNEPTSSENASLIDQLRRVVQDGIDYAGAAMNLLQTQLTALALSSVAFLMFIFFTVLSAITAFVLLSVALGLWLTHQTGSAGWALLIIGGVYALIAVGLGGFAFRWLNKVKS